MPFFLKRILPLFLLMGLPIRLPALDCSVQRHSDPTVAILPFKEAKGLTNSPSSALGVLLKEYLSHIKGVTLLPIAPEKDLKSTPRFRITGTVSPEGKNPNLLQFVGGLYSTAQGEEEIFHFKESFEFPLTMNDLLLTFVEQLSPYLIGKKFESKKLLPYINASRSVQSLNSFVQGELDLNRYQSNQASSSIEEAIKSFRQAIEADYNYVPAYLGLARALAVQSFVDKSHGETAKGEAYAQMSRAEIAKAQLLHPPLTEFKQPWIEYYLTGGKRGACPQ